MQGSLAISPIISLLNYLLVAHLLHILLNGSQFYFLKLFGTAGYAGICFNFNHLRGSDSRISVNKTPSIKRNFLYMTPTLRLKEKAAIFQRKHNSLLITVFDMYLLLGLSSLFNQNSRASFKIVTYYCTLTKSIRFDCFDVLFVPPFSKKLKTFKIGKKPGKHAHNFVIFSEATGQTWYRVMVAYHLSALGRTVYLMMKEKFSKTAQWPKHFFIKLSEVRTFSTEQLVALFSLINKL